MAIITHLFRKEKKHVPVQPKDSLYLKKGWGIEGDLNASPISPRQVLITRYEDLVDMHIPFGGLRENIIVQGLSAEEFKSGAKMTIGNVVLKLTFYCEPCKRIEDVVPSIQAVFHKRGILAVVITEGEIVIGDEVMLSPGYYTPLSENPTERFLSFVSLIPRGKVVTYKTVAKAMGVAEGFIRAMPGYIKRALGSDIPVHRIVDVDGNLIEKHIPDQKALLTAEGITIIENYIDLSTYLRKEQSLYLD